MTNDNELAKKHPIINWFINNPVAANLLMLAILLTGLYMVGFFGIFGQPTKLRLESFPSLESNTISVNTRINGYTSEDVEQGVTDKIEDALKNIQGIDTTTSKSYPNQSMVWIKAVTNYDISKLYEDVKRQVDSINGLPSEVESVVVKKRTFQPQILLASLSGNINEKTLKIKANKLKELLLASPFIELVYIYGEKPAEIRIEISKNTLKEYGITIEQIAAAINNNSLNLPSGTLKSDQGNVALRIKAQAKNQNDYENLIIRSGIDGSLIRLGDIAKVIDGFVEQDFHSEINGKNSLTISIRSSRNTNVIEADKAATEIINKFVKTLPKNITVTTWNNNVSHVRDRINLFVKNITIGGIFVLLLLALFLNLKLAFWVAIGIPVSFSGALIFMNIFDISINLVTLFGFILVLGIVVDDAIVIGESVYSWKKRTNNAPSSTIKGVSRVSFAATFGVLTTIAAFLPLTQIEGRQGQLLGQIGFIVIFCLLFSLIESKLILPAHLYKVRVANDKHKTNNSWEKIQISIAQGLENMVEKFYLPLLTKALRVRYFTLLIFLSALILAVGSLLGNIVKVAMMPKVEFNFISLIVEMDNNLSFEKIITTSKRATNALRIADNQLMQKEHKNETNVVNIAAFINDNKIEIWAELAGADKRNISAFKIIDRWRQVMGKIQEAKSVNYSSNRRSSMDTSDIEMQVLTDDRKSQQEASIAITAALNNIAGVKDVTNNQNEANREILIKLKPEANIYGIDKIKLAKAVRAAFYGKQAKRIQIGNEEVHVMIRHPKNERNNIADLYNLDIYTNKGIAIPLRTVANLSYTRSPKSIEHINGNRTLIISANIEKDKTSNEKVLAILKKEILPNIKKQYAVDVEFSGDIREVDKSINSMITGFIISLIVIYILLAIPMKSYIYPIIIMTSIPFGIIGAIIGHLILDMTMSMLSFFGIIALSGVVINDSLLLLTTIQQYRQEGMSINEAIRITGLRRFRPVILTSITTFVGLVPMLFETSFQAKFIIPMAVSLGFGILFATAITLLLIPIVYAIFADIKILFLSKINKKLD